MSKSDDSLKIEAEMIESLDLICGSPFCNLCYRMLKRSSLFLKCSGCCDKAFNKYIQRSSDRGHRSIPPNSICIGCNNTIRKGEIVTCICCYIRSEFFKDYSQTDCEACSNPELTNWVDTYVGHQFEMVECGFCKRSVNYLYIMEVCAGCHDSICLHCLRKNPFIAQSVCNECHSRREANPKKKINWRRTE